MYNPTVFKNIVKCECDSKNWSYGIPSCVKCNKYDKGIITEEVSLNNHYQYVFVFSESLNKTSIQYNELISLIKRTLSPEEVLIEIKEYNSTILEDNLISNLDRVTIIKFTNSCIVKSSIKLDLEKIIKNSGYIHSCGVLVFCKQWDSITTNDLINNINSFVDKEKAFCKLSFYTDVDIKDLERNVDNIMIDKERTYIGKKFFSKEINTILEKVNEHLADKNLSSKNNINNIFVYKDESHNSFNGLEFYDEQDVSNTLIAYNSLYKKDNALHILDHYNESKPYWAGIYTTPHNLTNAMLNIAQIKEGEIIFDPFLHTGTTILEAAKYGCTVIGSDYSEPIGAKDNIEFLLDIDNLQKRIDRINNKIHDTAYLSSLQEIINSSMQNGNDAFSNYEKIEELINANPILENIEDRVIFYILRRYTLRQLQGIAQKNTRENELEEKIKLFNNYKELACICCDNPNGWYPNDKNNIKENTFVNDANKYNTMRIGPVKHNDFKYFIMQTDASKLYINDNSVDVIVTDPPYGYGDDIDDAELVNLYINFINESFRILKPGGRIVMCVLDKVKTGKPINPRTVTKGVIDMIEKVTKEKRIKFMKKELIAC